MFKRKSWTDKDDVCQSGAGLGYSQWVRFIVYKNLDAAKLIATASATRTTIFCLERLSERVHTLSLRPPSQGAGVTRNFDLCVAPKSVAGETTKPYVFSGIDRAEYTSLYSFLSTKKLRIKNIKQSGNDGSMLQLGNLDDHDPYKAVLDEDQVTNLIGVKCFNRIRKECSVRFFQTNNSSAASNGTFRCRFAPQDEDDEESEDDADYAPGAQGGSDVESSSESEGDDDDSDIVPQEKSKKRSGTSSGSTSGLKKQVSGFRFASTRTILQAFRAHKYAGAVSPL